jgi:hypothetical protein
VEPLLNTARLCTHHLIILLYGRYTLLDTIGRFGRSTVAIAEINGVSADPKADTVSMDEDGFRLYQIC